MPFSQILGPELPYLRRFARSLTGTQKAGDAYAAATLEAILAASDIFDRSLPPRVALYRVFLKVWNSVALHGFTETGPCSVVERSATRNLEALTPRPRVAFLLRAVEDFTQEQIAIALDCSVEEVGTLLDVAGREIAQQIATDVLIVEDEPVIAMDLEALVLDMGHSLIGIARTHAEALHLVETQKPGLVLADIQLADGSSGLNATNDILKSVSIPVIFITAYPEQLLTGTTAEPAFLIAKPFKADTVKAAISQALFFGQNARPIVLKHHVS